ncbi:MAG: hypothetical protein ACLS3Q_08480 [Lachnospira sp.]
MQNKRNKNAADGIQEQYLYISNIEQIEQIAQTIGLFCKYKEPL